MRARWREPIARTLATSRELTLDLRSEGYVALGPAPAGSWYVRVVSEDDRGRRVALSHFNKKSKGEFARAVVSARPEVDDVADLLSWAATAGWRLEPGAPGEVELVV